MKPSTVKWINGLIFLRFAAGFMIIIFGIIIVLTQPKTGFFKGFGDSLYSAGFLVEGDLTQNLRILLSSMISPFVFAAGTYLLLKYKKKIGFYILVTLDVLFTVILGALPIVSLIILILGFQKQTRDYFDQNITQIN